jgi:hypothetical protein
MTHKPLFPVSLLLDPNPGIYNNAAALVLHFCRHAGAFWWLNIESAEKVLDFREK